MMSVNECLTDESNIYLIKGKYIKLDENNHICAEKTDKKIYIKNYVILKIFHLPITF